MEKIRANLWKILSVVIPVVVIVSLILLGTAKDLEITKALSSFSLEEGKYYSSNRIANLIEIFGTAPIWFMAYFACMILFRYFYDKKGNYKLLQWVFVVGMVGVAALFLRECFKEYYRHHGTEYLTNKFDMLLIYVVFGMFCTVFSYYFYRNIDAKNNNKLMNMAFVIIGSCAFILIVETIKSPLGRIRYRTMNSIEDFSYYVPWYHIGNKTQLDKTLFPSDAFKSFPSGHSFSASMIFNLICLPEIFEKLNNKKSRIIINSCCTVILAVVILFRLIAGAHFLTDCMFSVLLGYTAIRVMKYFFCEKKIIKIPE